MPELGASALAVLLAGLVMMAFALPGRATEESDQQVVRCLADAAVRQYTPYTVAEVIVPGPAAEAGSRAFPILAGYLFGKNKGERRLAMTAPVTQAPAAGGFLVQFVLPRGVTSASAPAPLDARVRLRDLTPVAVIRCSGFWSDANDAEHITKLQSALRAAALAWEGEPVHARHDAPLTPCFLRRNAIWLPLAPAR